MKANADKCHLLVTRDTDVTAKIGELDVKNSMEERKTSWCQNRWQTFFQKSCFYPLQKGKPKVTCTPKSRKFYGSSEK